MSHSAKLKPASVEYSSAEGHVLKKSPVLVRPAKSRKSVIPGKDTDDPGNLFSSSSTNKTKRNRTCHIRLEAFNPVMHGTRGCRKVAGQHPAQSCNKLGSRSWRQYTSWQATGKHKHGHLLLTAAPKSLKCGTLHLFLTVALKAA